MLRPVEHVEVLAQIGGQVELAELGFAPAEVRQKMRQTAEKLAEMHQ